MSATGEAARPDAGGAVAPDVSCAVCDFVEDSVERRMAYILAEDLGSPSFVESMRRGGWCVRHARRVAGSADGPRFTRALRTVIEGWVLRSAGGGGMFRIGGGCPPCETRAWAEAHALGSLANPHSAQAGVDPSATGSVCLRHLDLLIDRVTPGGIDDVASRIRARVRQASDSERLGPMEAAACVAGRDPDASCRGDGSLAPATDAPRREGPGWTDGSFDLDGLVDELGDGRCPVCSAIRAAARNFLVWLGEPGGGEERHRDADAVCVEHLHDAAASIPLAAERAVSASIERWGWMADRLVDLGVPSERVVDRVRRAIGAFRAAHGTDRSRGGWALAVEALRADPASVAARRIEGARSRRRRTCIACEAAVAAAERTSLLVGVLLTRSAGRRAYESTDGLCLSHAASAIPLLGAEASAAVAEAAGSRAARVAWELDEALRKSSWSRRYEPRGREAVAWTRAFSAVLGDAVFAVDLLASEPHGPREGA